MTSKLKPMIDLLTLSPDLYADLLKDAALLGSQHAKEGKPALSGKEILPALDIGRWRNGHITGLRHAYGAGYWHVSTNLVESRREGKVCK